LRFRHLLEESNLSIQLLATINATLATKGLMLKTGTVVDATLIAAPRCRCISGLEQGNGHFSLSHWLSKFYREILRFINNVFTFDIVKPHGHWISRECINANNQVCFPYSKLAAELVLDKSQPLADIAARLGYSSPSCFSQAFKRWHGVSPSQFRQHQDS
jgi:AraC-like DNA-binding protein